MPLIRAFWKQQISDLEANLIYKASSRTARANERNPVMKKKQNKAKTPPHTHTYNLIPEKQMQISA